MGIYRNKRGVSEIFQGRVAEDGIEARLIEALRFLALSVMFPPAPHI